MLVVPLLGFIFLKMGPVVVPISGTPGLAQEMGHPYLIWLDGAPKLEPFQGPKPKPQTHHKNESKGVFFSPLPPAQPALWVYNRWFVIFFVFWVLALGLHFAP